MVFVGGLTGLGLWLLGIDVPLTLAVVAAILTFIPNLGPTIAAVPAVLLGLLDGLGNGGLVVVTGVKHRRRRPLVSPGFERDL